MNRLLCLFILVLAACGPKAAVRQAETAPETVASGRVDFVHGLDATLWVRKSAEYRALCQQTFRMANEQLDALVQDKNHSAIPAVSASAKPPAIIFDLDETLLDNSYYQVELIQGQKRYDKASWMAWCDAMKAEAIAGALAFTKRATAQGVTCIYISNRYHESFDVTKKNLLKLGFPLKSDDHLLLRKANRDKQERRLLAAESFRVVMLFGDSLGDFDSRFDAAKQSLRAQALQETQSHFGYDWIVLPNPMYGTWLFAAQDFPAGKNEGDTAKKIRALQ